MRPRRKRRFRIVVSAPAHSYRRCAGSKIYVSSSGETYQALHRSTRDSSAQGRRTAERSDNIHHEKGLFFKALHARPPARWLAVRFLSPAALRLMSLESPSSSPPLQLLQLPRRRPVIPKGGAAAAAAAAAARGDDERRRRQ